MLGKSERWLKREKGGPLFSYRKKREGGDRLLKAVWGLQVRHAVFGCCFHGEVGEGGERRGGVSRRLGNVARRGHYHCRERGEGKKEGGGGGGKKVSDFLVALLFFVRRTVVAGTAKKGGGKEKGKKKEKRHQSEHRPGRAVL